MIRIRNGFTMVELAVVVMVIGIFAALVVPRYVGAQSDTRVTAAGEDIMGMVKSFEYFNANNGYWPAEANPGVLPPEIKSQFTRENPFLKVSSVGGVFDYDHVVFDGARTISITLRGTPSVPKPTIVDAQALDAYLDDGVLNTGKFRSIEGGYTYTFYRQ